MWFSPWFLIQSDYGRLIAQQLLLEYGKKMLVRQSITLKCILPNWHVWKTCALFEGVIVPAFQLTKSQFCSCVVYHTSQSTMGTCILFHVNHSLFECIYLTTFAQNQEGFWNPFVSIVCRTRGQDEHQWRGCEAHWCFGQRGGARWAGSLHVQPLAYPQATQLQPKCPKYTR